MRGRQRVLGFGGLGLCLGLLAGLSGCTRSPIEELSGEELFSLGLGRMENQIDLFQLPGELFNSHNTVTMRDGLFYIVNGKASKVMGFSSYGDLIFLLYNPDTNPEPISLAAVDSDQTSTRVAARYALRDIGEIAVDSAKRLYLCETVPEGREVRDAATGVILNHLILRFDRQGKYLDFIGQDGVGGSPFPYIDSLHITESDELVVVSRSPKAWLAFWYSPAGQLLYQVSLEPEKLPKFREDLIPFVAKVFPDHSGHSLYVMLYYTRQVVYESTELKETMSSDAARIYRLDLADGRYAGFTVVPQESRRRERIGSREADVPGPAYELLGVSASRHFFLLRPEDTNLFRLLILDAEGKIVARRILVIEDSELYFRTMSLSSAGILYALFCEESQAKVVWWRSDRLVRETRP